MPNYLFDEKIDNHHKELILEAIRILNELNAPITDECYFAYNNGASRYGYCEKSKKHKYTIHLNEAILEEDAFINTAIHELLHTVPEVSRCSAHKGRWAKWAKIVSEKTKYKITRLGDDKFDPSKLKTPNYHTTIGICPLCGDKTEIISNENPLIFAVPCKNKCQEPYFSKVPPNPFKGMSASEMEAFVFKAPLNEMPLDDFFSYLAHLPYELTKRLIIEYVHSNLFSVAIKETIRPYLVIDKKVTMSLVADKYIEGYFDDSLPDLFSIYEFEGLFALTDYWMKATEHGKELIKRLGIK